MRDLLFFDRTFFVRSDAFMRWWINDVWKFFGQLLQFALRVMHKFDAACKF